MYSLGIVWIYNFIWFVPLDFIKFVLQASFNRSLHAVKPFEHIHRRLIASRQARAVVPEGVAQDLIKERRVYMQQASLRQESVEEKPGVIDHVAEFGSSFYSSYTDPLSALRKLNPLLRRISTVE